MKIYKLMALIIFVQFATRVSAQTTEKELLVAATKLYAEKRNEEALQNCNKALEINPSSAWGYNIRGSIYNQKEDYEKAIKDYTKAINLVSNYQNAFSNRALAYLSLKKYDLAIEDFSQSIILLPTANDYYSRGYTYQLKENYDRAIEDYSQAIKLDPADDKAYMYRIQIYQFKGMFDLAIADATEVINIKKNIAYGYNTRGYIYELKGQYNLSIPDYTEAIRLSPTYTRAYINRGVSNKLKGSYYAAITDFERAIELEPKDGLAYVNIMSPLVRLQQFAKAKEYFEKYKSQDPGAEAYLKLWGSYYEKYWKAVTEYIPTGNFEQALENIDTGLKEFSAAINAENKESYIDLLALKGFVLEKLNRNQEAVDAYNQALVIHTVQPEVTEELAAIRNKQQVIASTDKTSPEIEVISPETKRGLIVVSSQSIVQIVGRATDLSGIASVSINGNPITKIEEDGLFVSSISLKSGSNDILIIAVDKKGNAATKTFTLVGNTKTKINDPEIIPILVTDKVPIYHAILIAEKDYIDKSIPDLENPVKDAIELKTILENNYTFSSKNIQTIYNKSREEIMQAIVSKSNSLTESDNLLIFYAGHGIAEKDKFGDVDGYWVPSSATKGLNATYISSDDINKALKRSNAKHILVIADACFSGAFTRDLGSDASVGIQKQFAVSSRKIMASGNLEPVPDNSRFVYYLKKNLKDNKEKYLTAKKLFDSFYEAILNNSETSPQYAAIKNVGDEGGEFVFIKK